MVDHIKIVEEAKIDIFQKHTFKIFVKTKNNKNMPIFENESVKDYIKTIAYQDKVSCNEEYNSFQEEKEELIKRYFKQTLKTFELNFKLLKEYDFSFKKRFFKAISLTFNIGYSPVKYAYLNSILIKHFSIQLEVFRTYEIEQYEGLSCYLLFGKYNKFDENSQLKMNNIISYQSEFDFNSSLTSVIYNKMFQLNNKYGVNSFFNLRSFSFEKKIEKAKYFLSFYEKNFNKDKNVQHHIFNFFMIEKKLSVNLKLKKMKYNTDYLSLFLIFLQKKLSKHPFSLVSNKDYMDYSVEDIDLLLKTSLTVYHLLITNQVIYPRQGNILEMIFSFMVFLYMKNVNLKKIFLKDNVDNLLFNLIKSTISLNKESSIDYRNIYFSDICDGYTTEHYKCGIFLLFLNEIYNILGKEIISIEDFEKIKRNILTINNGYIPF